MPRFSLRLMLAAVTVACIALGAWVVPAERQRRAVAAIKAAGGRVRYASRDPEAFPRRWLPRDYFDAVSDVSLLGTGATVTDDVLAQLEALSTLRSLRLDNTRITDAVLVHLEGRRKLEVLSLEGTPITDAALPHLQRLTSLRRLWLFGTKVTDEGVSRLQNALPNCRISHSSTIFLAI